MRRITTVWMVAVAGAIGPRLMAAEIDGCQYAAWDVRGKELEFQKSTAGSKPMTFRVSVGRASIYGNSRRAAFLVVRDCRKLAVQEHFKRYAFGGAPGNAGVGLRIGPDRLRVRRTGFYNALYDAHQAFARLGDGVFQVVEEGESVQPMLILPRRVETGLTWTDTIRLKNVTLTRRHEIAAVAMPIVVPAGRYETIAVWTKVSPANQPQYTIVRYYAKGIGVVREVRIGGVVTVTELKSINTANGTKR